MAPPSSATSWRAPTAALDAGCDVLPVCNDRAIVAKLLDELEFEVEPAAHLRLVRMRGRPAPERDELFAGDAWRASQDLLARSAARAQAQSHGGQRMNGFQGDFLRGALDVSPDGVVICEASGDRARGVRQRRVLPAHRLRNRRIC